MRTILLTLFLIKGAFGFGQFTAKELKGRYSVEKTPVVPDTAVLDFIEPPGIQVPLNFTIDYSYAFEELRLKSRGRFEMVGKLQDSTNLYAVNFPSLLGDYEVVGDTLVLHLKESRQDIRENGKVKRVKGVIQTDYRWIISNKNTIEIVESQYWSRKED